MYAHTPTGVYISHRFNANSKDDTLVALLHDLCYDMMYCANERLLGGKCLEEGAEFIQPYLADGDITESVMAIGGEWLMRSVRLLCPVILLDFSNVFACNTTDRWLI